MTAMKDALLRAGITAFNARAHLLPRGENSKKVDGQPLREEAQSKNQLVPYSRETQVSEYCKPKTVKAGRLVREAIAVARVKLSIEGQAKNVERHIQMMRPIAYRSPEAPTPRYDRADDWHREVHGKVDVNLSQRQQANIELAKRLRVLAAQGELDND